MEHTDGPDLSAAVRAQVIEWQGAIGEVVTSRTADVPAFAGAESREAAVRTRRLVEDPHTRELLLALADGVLGPQDAAEGARTFISLSPALGAAGIDLGTVQMPRTLTRFGAKVDAAAARVAPRRTRQHVTDHLSDISGTLLDTADDLAEELEYLQEAGLHADLELLGTMPVGPSHARRRAEVVRALVLATNGVQRVTVDASDLAPELYGPLARARDLTGGDAGTAWDVDAAVDLLGTRLRPVMRAVREARVELTFTSPAQGAHLALAALRVLLREPEFLLIPAGVGMAVTAPDALREQILELARERVAEGGAPLGLRLLTGTEARQDELGTSSELAAQLRALVRPELAEQVTLTLASDRLEDHAAARVLAQENGVSVPRVLLSAACPPERAYVLARDLDVAVQRFGDTHPNHGGEEDAGEESLRAATVQAVHRLVAATDAAAVDIGDPQTDDPASSSGRGGGAHPARDAAVTAATGPDPADPLVRQAARDAAAQWPADPEPTPVDGQVMASLVTAGRAAAESWCRHRPVQRAAALTAAADLLETERATLLGGGPAALIDQEISEACDLLRTSAAALRQAFDALATDGTQFVADRLTLALPHPHAPVLGAVAALAGALGAGSAVILAVPARTGALTQQVAHLVRQALAAQEAPEGLVRVIVTDEVPLDLAALDAIDAVTVAEAGVAREIAAVRASRPGGPRVSGAPTGPNRVHVAAGAHPERAAVDLVASAFARGGQAPGAVSLATVDTGIAGSQRFRTALVEATAALPRLPALEDEPSADLLRALSLEEGESWLVEPRALDEESRSWLPGVKIGVRPGSVLATRQVVGPVLGLMITGEAMPTFPAALTGAVHAQDAGAVDRALGQLDAAHVVVNRPVVGAVARGYGAMAGAGSVGVPAGARVVDPARGGEWIEDALPSRQDEPADAVRAALIDYTGLVTNQADRSWLRAAVGSDATAWARSLAGTHVSGTGEAQVRSRWTPVDLWVRAGSGTAVVELVRVLLAAEAVGATVRVSLSSEISRELKSLDQRGEPARLGLRRLTPLVDRVEDASSFAARVRSGTIAGRVRVLGEDADALPGVLAGRDVDLEVAPVSANGRCELPAYLRAVTLAR